jgi:uncharacterized protein (DUF433 family)
MGKPRALTSEQEDQAIVDYEEGMTFAEIGAKFGCTPGPIQRLLRQRGVKARPPHVRAGRVVLRPATRRFTEEQERDLAARYQNGAFVGELADEAGVSRKAVNNALRRQGVQLRDKKESQAHLNRLRRERGERNPNFKGGRVVTADGYVLASIDETDPLWPMAKARSRKDYVGYVGTGYVLEHRLVMARHLGRPLLSNETVHHKRRKDDNRIENLELWSSRHPAGQRVEDLREFAKEILAHYPD